MEKTKALNMPVLQVKLEKMDTSYKIEIDD